MIFRCWDKSRNLSELIYTFIEYVHASALPLNLIGGCQRSSGDLPSCSEVPMKNDERSLSGCWLRRLTLIPGQSNLSSPIQARREEDFYITSNIDIDCNTSFAITYQWLIRVCSSINNCSSPVSISSSEPSSSNEYFLPARTLPLGLYQLELNMNITSSSRSTVSEGIYLLITPSGITANLVELGTSLISSGVGQAMQFNPGLYSIDLDEDQFNASVRSILSLSR